MGANQTLRKLLVDDIILPLLEIYGKKSCVLSEDKAGYSFTLRGLPDDALIIKCDRFPNMGEVFFQGKNGECKRADYVLVSELEKVIMFFELKSSTKSASSKDIIAQLKGAKCIIDYCASISSAFLGEHSIFTGFTYKYYKGIIKAPQKRSFAKQETTNATPETAKTLSGNYAAFGRLLDE